MDRKQIIYTQKIVFLIQIRMLKETCSKFLKIGHPPQLGKKLIVIFQKFKFFTLVLAPQNLRETIASYKTIFFLADENFFLQIKVLIYAYFLTFLGSLYYIPDIKLA